MEVLLPLLLPQVHTHTQLLPLPPLLVVAMASRECARGLCTHVTRPIEGKLQAENGKRKALSWLCDWRRGVGSSENFQKQQ